MKKLKDSCIINLTKDMVEVFIKLCSTCSKNSLFQQAGIVFKPIVTQKFNGRIQVDISDYQSCPDQKFKFVLNIQDHYTKFCILHPLMTEAAAVIAMNLIDAFRACGVPDILQIDHGCEFVNCTMLEVKNLWLHLKIVQGKPRKPPTQRSVEKCNGDVKAMSKK